MCWPCARPCLEAVELARREGKPTLIEAQTYRFMGHSMSDPVSGVYRTKEELEEHKANDPIRIFIDRLQDAGLLTEAELKSIDARAHDEVQDAVDFAEASPEPDPAGLREHVYTDMNVHGRLFFDALAGSGSPHGPVEE